MRLALTGIFVITKNTSTCKEHTQWNH